MVFTPPDLARRLVEPLIARIGPDTPILDPACGEGALLLAALEGLGGGPEAARRLRGIEIDPRLTERARARLARACGRPEAEFVSRIVVANALAAEALWPRGSAIVANPPWISYSGRQSGSAHPGATIPEQRGGWPSLHGAFLEAIARHCSREGTSARVLLPASLLELPGYSPLRETVSALVHPTAPPEELGEAAFPGVIEPAAILSLGPGPTRERESRPGAPRQTCSFLHGLERLPRLPPSTFGDPGIHTGNSAAQIVSTSPQAGWAPLRRGADLFPYDLRAPSLWLRLDLEATPERRFRFGPLERYRGVLALVRQTADRPIAALHSKPTYFRNSLLAVREVPGLHPAFVVALLNSEVAALWHRSRFRDARQRSFPQVKVGHLRTQPIPISRREQDPYMHDAIVEQVSRLRPGTSDFEEGVRWIDLRIRRAFEAAVSGPTHRAEP